MTIKGRSNSAALPLGLFRAKISSPVETGPKMAACWENRGLNVKLWFRNPQKAHSASFDVFYVKIGECVLAVDERKNPKK